MSAANNFDKRVDLVLEGGGVKGIALVGALATLEKHGYIPQNVAGSSAGAIVATLLAAGYDAKSLEDTLRTEKFELYMDKGWEDRLPSFIGVPLGILMDQGIFEGKYFQKHMEELLEEKNVRTFKDLIHPEFADQPDYRYKVQVIVSDITARKLLVLPRDAEQFGINPDDLNVALAVRMSMSFPFFFEPVRQKNPSTGVEHILVDGGMLSNYPVWLFDSDGKPDWPTFGLRLVESDTKASIGSRLPVLEWAEKNLGDIVPFILNLVSTALEAHDRQYIETANFARTIAIPTLGVSTLNFELPDNQVDALYESGEKAADEFLKTWDFESYIAEFRSGKEYSRRKKLLEQIRTPTNV